MDLQLEGRTALVTGASMGIGNAIARALAAEGVRIALAARRGELLERLAEDIEASGGMRPAIIPIDMLKPRAPRQLASAAFKALDHIDILINSAGGSSKLSVDAPDELWEEGVTLNFTRVRQLTHRVVPEMIKCRWGRIINISGKSEPDQMDAAFAAKAAIHIWNKMLSREVGRYGITVNSIAPGKIISEQILRNYSEEERNRLARDAIPIGRLGEPKELANLAVFLASPLAGYITGTVIPFDGGLRRYAF